MRQNTLQVLRRHTTLTLPADKAQTAQQRLEKLAPLLAAKPASQPPPPKPQAKPAPQPQAKPQAPPQVKPAQPAKPGKPHARPGKPPPPPQAKPNKPQVKHRPPQVKPAPRAKPGKPAADQEAAAKARARQKAKRSAAKREARRLQWEAKAAGQQKRVQSVMPLVELRQQCFLLFPAVFSIEPQPMARGIHTQLAAETGLSLAKIRKMLSLWATDPIYLRAVIHRPHRLNLDGSVAEPVSDTDRAVAAAMLEKFKQRQGLQAQSHDAAPPSA